MRRRWGGVVLAGGEARRLGGINKSALRLNRKTFLDITVSRLEPHVEDIAISLRSQSQSEFFLGHNLIYDHLVDGRAIGPAGAILSALQWAESMGLEGIITVPVDTPCLPENFIEKLLDFASVEGTCHARSWRGPEWAHGVWMCRDTSILTNALEKEKGLALRQVHQICKSKAIEFRKMKDSEFLNINTSSDYDVLCGKWN